MHMRTRLRLIMIALEIVVIARIDRELRIQYNCVSVASIPFHLICVI